MAINLHSLVKSETCATLNCNKSSPSWFFQLATCFIRSLRNFEFCIKHLSILLVRMIFHPIHKNICINATANKMLHHKIKMIFLRSRNFIVLCAIFYRITSNIKYDEIFYEFMDFCWVHRIIFSHLSNLIRNRRML